MHSRTRPPSNLIATNWIEITLGGEKKAGRKVVVCIVSDGGGGIVSDGGGQKFNSRTSSVIAAMSTCQEGVAKVPVSERILCKK